MLTNNQILDIRAWYHYRPRWGKKRGYGMIGRGKKDKVREGKRIREARAFKKNKHISPVFIRFKKWVLALFGLGPMILCLSKICAYGCMTWERSDYGIGEIKISSVCVIKEMPDVVFAGGEMGVYRSINAGKDWVRVLMITGGRKGVNFISYDPKGPSTIYAATADGLYFSLDSGESWENRFRGRDDAQRDIRCVAVSSYDDTVFIGTERGLFKSTDSGRHWSPEHYFINKSIRSCAIAQGFCYVCANDGIYYQKGANSDWDKAYNLIRYEDDMEESLDEDDEDNDAESRHSSVDLNSIVIRADTVYVSTGDGILSSRIGSQEWRQMDSEGLMTKKIDFIMAEDAGILAAGRGGISLYEMENDIWVDRSIGLSTLNITMINGALDKGIIFAATEKGLFRAFLNNDTKSEGRDWISRLRFNEPGIDEILQAAISYAEVSPDKIKWMRSAARNQALVPKITLGICGDINRNIDLDRGGTNDADFYIEGPRQKKWGWDIGLTWNLGELIWSYHQTSIDVRSRLMVQLRNDILDEVTKLYFERLRLKDELIQGPPQGTRQKALKELRLEELTTNIDALTGGYLSAAKQRIE
jgi:photosystem II stability/assembly factor-like uncharacterized protein